MCREEQGIGTAYMLGRLSTSSGIYSALFLILCRAVSCRNRSLLTGDQEPSDQDGNASTSTHAAEPNGPYDTAPAVPSGKTYGMTPGGPNVADGTSAAVPAAAAGDASTCGNWKGGKGAAIGRWDSRQGGARADAAGDEEDLEGGGDFHEGVDEGPVADGGVYGGHKGAPVAGTLERALGYEDDEDEGGAGAGPQVGVVGGCSVGPEATVIVV